MIFKRQDACHELTILGFEINCNTDDECELLEASPLPPRRIEVYGDSVSAGEVSEAVDYVAKAIQNITENTQTAGIPMHGLQHENLMHSCMTSLRAV